jgi:putative phosphoribosyl transferase
MRIVPWIPSVFHDRADGGRALAEELAGLGLAEPLVVGVARGGVAPALEVARTLRTPLTAVDVEGVNAHGLRLGATTAAGPPYLREDDRIAAEDLRRAVERARRAAEALETQLELAPTSVAGRTVVLVDDGVITGLTLAAACRWARALQAKSLIAAAPVGHLAGLERIRDEADTVVCPRPLEQIAVVGQAYDSFEPLDEWYVAGLLSGG